MKKFLGLSVCAVAVVLSANAVQAAGYQLNEYSAAGMGRSFAGAGVVGDDFSAIGFNPAGMQLNKTSGVQAGASVVSLYSDYNGVDGGVSGSGDTRITRVLPNGFGQYKLTPDMTVGLGVYVPFGLATDYKNGWFAESHGGLSQITGLNVSPAVSYQVSKMVALGAALNLQHATARITSASIVPGLIRRSNDLTGSDWGVGYSVGATFTPREGTRLGVSYRSKISHELKGKIKISGLPAGHPANGKHHIAAKITTPETLFLSASQDINDQFTVSATARWTRWSRFKNLDILTNDTTLTPVSGATISSTHENWSDSWFYALGLDYKYSKAVTLRVGTAYDETAIKSAEYRTVRIPDGRRIWTSVGISYTVDKWQIDAGYAHLFVKTERANGKDKTASSTPNIKYASDANMLSLGVQYKF